MGRANLTVVSVVDAVAADLRARILSGDLTPGHPLGEVDLAGQYDVARPTVRAAIESLVAAGLLTRGAHKSARVTQLNAEDVTDVYNTRARVEAEVVRALATSATALNTARQANRELRLHLESDALTIVDHDMAFHAELIRAAGSPRTSKLYATLADEVRLCMAQTQRADLLRVDEIAGEHDALLDYIERGEIDAAVHALRTHLDQARDRLVRHVGNSLA